MTTQEYPEYAIIEVVRDLTGRQRAAFAAAAAERSALNFRYFRQGSRRDVLDDALAAMWTAIAAGDAATLDAVWARLQLLPEYNIEGQSELREYYAAWAISAVQFLPLLMASSLPQDIRGCIDHALDIAQAFDATLGDDPGGPASFVALEIEAQALGVRALVAAPELPISELHAVSQPLRRAYVAAAPRVAAVSGWELADPDKD